MKYDNFMRFFLPHYIKKLKDGSYIFLNREYKPLGHTNTGEWVVYENHVSRFELDQESEKLLKTIIFGTDEHKDGTIMYLYDYNKNWFDQKFLSEFFEMLKKLSDLKIINYEQSKYH